MSVKNNRIILPSGMSYRVMVLPDDQLMTPATLKKNKRAAEAGATIIGPRPKGSPSLSGYPGCDKKVKQMADELLGQEYF